MVVEKNEFSVLHSAPFSANLLPNNMLQWPKSRPTLNYQVSIQLFPIKCCRVRSSTERVISKLECELSFFLRYVEFLRILPVNAISTLQILLSFSKKFIFSSKWAFLLGKSTKNKALDIRKFLLINGISS